MLPCESDYLALLVSLDWLTGKSRVLLKAKHRMGYCGVYGTGKIKVEHAEGFLGMLLVAPVQDGVLSRLMELNLREWVLVKPRRQAYTVACLQP